MHPTPFARRPRGAAAMRTLALLAATLLAACELVTAPGDELPRIPDDAADIVADTLRARYIDDAARLAVRYLDETGAPGAGAVEIPAEYTTSFYNALAAVYALHHPARDSVIEIYRIRTFPNPALYEVLVAVDEDHAWTHAWAEGRSLTGEPDVDALVKAYDLVVTKYYANHDTHADDQALAVLRAAMPLNIAALADRFERIAGVRYAEPNGVIGDGGDIRAR
ncbi:MAG TPA: hypothetical protein VF188_03730, partial [Longimicrobiales bacterium]